MYEIIVEQVSYCSMVEPDTVLLLICVALLLL